MKITAFIMGIAHPDRMRWLLETITHMDQQNFPFAKKIVSIDQFDGHTVDFSTIKSLEDNGWVVLIDNFKSRIASMDRAFNLFDTEYVFYNEDDVKANLPKIEDLEFTFNHEIDGRKCGMISMTLGGTQFDSASNFIGDLKFMEDNKIMGNDEYLIFRRMEEFRNDWFFEFPGLFIRTDLFKTCHESAKGRRKQIEQSLTDSYFNNWYDKIYYKCSIAKSNALDILLSEPSKVNSDCRLLENLDPHQGNGYFGGLHLY